MFRTQITMHDPAAIKAAEELSRLWVHDGKSFTRGVQDLIIREAQAQEERIELLRRADLDGQRKSQ